MNKKIYKDFDKLVEYLNSFAKTKEKKLNTDRYQQMALSAAQLHEILRVSNEGNKIEVDTIDDFNIGSVSVELSELTVTNPTLFCKIISACDNFEIYPLTNGKIRLGLTFRQMFNSMR